MQFKLLIFILSLFFITSNPNIKAAEDSTYNFNWLDPDKEVYVLQNRKFRKVQSLYVTAGYGKTTSGAFADATTMQGRFGFFFTEDWGFEFLYASNSSDTNEVFESVVAQQSVPFVRKTKSYFGPMIMWSPFYAKINTFDKIFYFDWMFGLGFAKLEEENNRADLNALQNGSGFQTENHTGVMWTTATRFYLTEMVSLRLDLTAVHYQAAKALANSTDKIWYDNFDLALSLGFAF